MPTDDPEDIRNAFYDNIAAYEEAETQSLFELLPEAGVALPSPESMDDAQLSAKLWEVIHQLALLRVYLQSTDHLSDRQLYEELWKESLREPMVLMPENHAFSYHIDLVGSGSEEDIQLYLKYYADEPARLDWFQSWPNDPLPERETPPYSRDHLLPQAQYETDEPLM